MYSEDFKVLSEMAEPLKEYLLNNYHSNCAIVITTENIKIVETQKNVPLLDSGDGL